MIIHYPYSQLVPDHYPYHQLVPEHLPKDKEILYQCDLMQCDHHWQLLYNALLPFAGFAFEHHQRLLILDHDTDYCPDESSTGNTLFNLIKLCSKLDISMDHAVILTGNYGCADDVIYLCDRYNLSYPKIFEFSQWYTYPPDISNSFVPIEDQMRLTHLYICLNYVPRTHRKIMIAMLHEKNLNEVGIISWHADKDVIERHKTKTIQLKNHDATIDKSWHLQTTTPFSRINSDLDLCRSSITLMSKHESLYLRTFKHPLITGRPNDIESRYDADFFNNALLFLITETVGQYRHVYFSEKTWKAIISKKPFLLLGAKNSLATLRRLGFQTFDSIWDEQYDQATTTFERADLISSVLDKLVNADWHSIALRCRPIVQHNYYNLKKLQQKHLEQLKFL